MFIANCLAYTDINAELSRQDESFTINVRSHQDTDISLTLNYLQVKVLAEGLLALIGQAPLGEVAENTKHPAGNIQLTFYIAFDDENDSLKEEEAACRPQPLSARTEMKPLFQTA